MNYSTSEKLASLTQTETFKERFSHYDRMLILGEKIYGRRKDLDLLQSDLAKRAETTQRIISELENGSYTPSNGIGEDLYNRLATGLEIDRDYLFSEKIDRKTFELFAYLGEKLEWKWDIMQFMKLPYFIDLNAVKELGFQITNFNYIRYEFGPFDKNIYTYRTLFENKHCKEVKFSYIKDFLATIDSTFESLPVKNGQKLKLLSYQTSPMKDLKATLKGKEGWMEKLDLRSKTDDYNVSIIPVDTKTQAKMNKIAKKMHNKNIEK